MGTLEEPRAMVVGETRDERAVAQTLYGIVAERAAGGDFLGPGLGVIRTHEVDRVLHGVDLVFEFRAEDHTATHLALSVEVVIPGHDPWDPFDAVRAEIDRDAVAFVKYFHSEWLGYKGGLKAPRAHVALDWTLLAPLLEPYTNGALQLTGTAAHRSMVRSLAVQLDVFTRYAEAYEKSGALAHLKCVRAELSRRIEALALGTGAGGDEDAGEQDALLRRLRAVFGDAEASGPGGRER